MENNSGAGGEVHHPMFSRSINLSQPSAQLTNNVQYFSNKKQLNVLTVMPQETTLSL